MRDFEMGGGDALETSAPFGDAKSNSVATKRYARPQADSGMTSSEENPAPLATPIYRSEAPDPVELVDRVEIEHLREMLREQQKATLRAVHTAADLQTKLTTAQTEVAKAGNTYYGFSKQARSAIAEKTAEIEIEKLNSQWQRTARDQDRQKREQRIAKLAEAQRELAAASVPESVPRAGSRWVRRAMISVSIAVGIVGLGVVLWRAPLGHNQSQGQSSGEARSSDASVEMVQTTTELPSKSPPFSDSAAGLPEGLSPEPAAALTSAMTQLDTVLSSFPGRAPEDILREASKINHSCRMQWNDGHPSLVFGGGPQLNSLSSTINQCAEAVKKLH